MSTSESYISHWLGFWNSLSDTSMARWSRAVHDARRRQYDTAALMSDWVCAIDDVTNAWCAGIAGPKQAELALFDIEQTTKTTGRSFPVFRPSCPAGNPDIIWLGPIGTLGNTGHPLKREHIEAYWIGTTGIEVRLSDLGNPTPQKGAAPRVQSPVKTGIYRFLVNAQQKVLLDVYVRVSPQPKTMGSESVEAATGNPPAASKRATLKRKARPRRPR